MNYVFYMNVYLNSDLTTELAELFFCYPVAEVFIVMK